MNKKIQSSNITVSVDILYFAQNRHIHISSLNCNIILDSLKTLLQKIDTKITQENTTVGYMDRRLHVWNIPLRKYGISCGGKILLSSCLTTVLVIIKDTMEEKPIWVEYGIETVFSLKLKLQKILPGSPNPHSICLYIESTGIEIDSGKLFKKCDETDKILVDIIQNPSVFKIRLPTGEYHEMKTIFQEKVNILKELDNNLQLTSNEKNLGMVPATYVLINERTNKIVTKRLTGRNRDPLCLYVRSFSKKLFNSEYIEVEPGNIMSRVFPGISISGKCHNGNCTLYCQAFVYNMGVPSIYNGSEDQIYCPKCSTYVATRQVYAYKCEYINTSSKIWKTALEVEDFSSVLDSLECRRLSSGLIDPIQYRFYMVTSEMNCRICMRKSCESVDCTRRIKEHSKTTCHICRTANEKEENLCAICLEHMFTEDTLKELECCKHVFHKDCIGRVIKKKCPLCRKSY